MSKPSSITVLSVRTAAVWLFAATLCGGGLASAQTTVRPNSKAAELQAKFEHLPPAQKARMQALIVQASKEDPSPDAQKEFRALMATVATTPEDASALYDITLVRTEYKRLVLEDGRASLKVGKAIKSPARDAYERRLVALGLLNDAQVAQSDVTVKKIGTKQPINNQGNDILLDQAMLDTALTELTTTKTRLDALFGKH